jgi:uncharacterized phage protein gp47/JayE
MNLKVKGFSQLVEDMSATLQSSATALVDVSVGSVLRAIFEANASIVLWLQWLVLQVLKTTRAATSTGEDLDSWMQDFGLARLPAVPATGLVTFSRYASNLSASIPIGTLVKTIDGSTSFSVAKDPTNSIWNPSTSCYVIPSGISSVDLPIVATVGGSAANVLPGTIGLIASPLIGVDQVNNTNTIVNGMDKETDQAFRRRFESFLASRSRATLTAIRDAIANVRQGLTALILENTGPDGTVSLGSFTIILDDGTGSPAADLLNRVTCAVDQVRPIGTVFSVLSPQVVAVDVAVTVTVSDVKASSSTIAAVTNSVMAYLNELTIGKSAFITRVAQRTYIVDNNIENVSDIKLNGISSDISPPPLGVIKAGSVMVTVNGG